MSSLSAAGNTAERSVSFEKLAGTAAILAGIVHFLYAVSFVIISRSAPETGVLLSAIFLLTGGLLSMLALNGAYQRLQASDPAFALYALLLTSLGTLGAAIHGGYDLANLLNPPASAPADLPSQIDPRGLLTFGVMGLGLLVVAWLMGHNEEFPSGLRYLGYTLAILFLVIYLARLIILNPANPILLWPVLAAGFVVHPAWYIWLGLSLQHGK
ncbi:MAG: hypothetical protein BroJett011_65770 [Chloroflexota bacterium]|nr:MAG: hypothetical protein BroJett011_65770 [Chloroflexota bacterium]